MPTEIEKSDHLPGAVATEPELRSYRIRDLEGDRHLTPGEKGTAVIVRSFASVIYGTAAAIIPEDPTAAARVSTAVFATLNARWKKLPRRALLAVWLFQTAVITAQQERKRMRLRRKPVDARAILLVRLDKLPKKLREPVILCELFGLEGAAAATSLRISEKRLKNRHEKGLKRLRKRLRKSGRDCRDVMAEVVGLAPPEAAETVLQRVGESAAGEPLVQQTIRSWRWRRIRTFLKRTMATALSVFCVLAVCFATFAYLATHGYLTHFFIRMGQKQAVKKYPEMLVPARAWPVTAEDQELARHAPPKTSEDLFGLTNIWPVKFTFTREQWEKIEPTEIPPIRNIFNNGRITLRNPQAKRSGLAGVLGFDFNWVEASLDFAGERFDKVAVRYRGNGTYLNSLYGNKQSLKLDVNKFVKGNRLAGIHELNFLNTVVDYSCLHDALAEDLFRKLGAVGPRTAYAYITIDPGSGKDEPRGLFVVLENIDGDFAEHRFGTKKAPIFKPVTYDLFDDLGDDWRAYEKIYDPKTKATPEQLRRVIDFAKLVAHASDTEFAQRLPEFLDLDEFAGFLGGHVLLSSYDGFLVNGQNFYVYLDPRSNKFGFVPWDQDHAWGDFGHMGSSAQRESASIWEPSTYDFKFLKRVMKVEAFRQIYREKLDWALKTVFSKEALFPKIDELAKQIRPAVAAESEFRLKKFDQAVSDQWLPGPRDGDPEGPGAPVHQIKRFVTNRTKAVRDQLDGKSKGARMTGFR